MGQSKPIPTKADTTPAKSADDYLREAREIKKQYGDSLQYKTDALAQYEGLMNKAIEMEERAMR